MNDTMMHLTGTCCRHCGAATEEISISGRHTNGQQFESRRYGCGFSLRWVPNYSREEVVGVCSKSEEFKDAQAAFFLDRDALDGMLQWVNVSPLVAALLEESIDRILKAVDPGSNDRAATAYSRRFKEMKSASAEDHYEQVLRAVVTNPLEARAIAHSVIIELLLDKDEMRLRSPQDEFPSGADFVSTVAEILGRQPHIKMAIDRMQAETEEKEAQDS